MESILEMKQNIADMKAELKAMTDAGMKMAIDKATEPEAIKTQSDKIDMMQARIALAEQALSGAEDKGAYEIRGSKPRSAFASFGEFAKAVKDADSHTGRRDARLIQDAATGANETTGADGGYLVPPEYADGILDLIKDESILYPQTRRVQIAGNRLIDIYLNETNRKDGVGGTRHGGVLAYWRAEAAKYEETRAAFGERETAASKLTAYCPVTEELLMDYPAIESYLNDLVGREFAWKMDDAILNGSGASNVPLGILTTSETSGQPNNAALVTIAKESGQAAGTILTANILKMYNALIAQNRANAKWYINQDVEIMLMQQMLQTGSITGSVASTGASKVEDVQGSISGTFGMPIYTPPGAFGNANATLLGLPVVPLEHCAAVGSVGDIVLADMSQYLIVERTNIMRQMSMHIRFDYDESVFKFTWRVGGRPDWMNKITAAHGDTARSPYVALAARA